MNAEDVLLVIAFAGLAAIAVLRIRFLRRPSLSEGPITRLFGVAAAALFVAVALLLLYFLTARITIEYVFSYTSTTTPMHYRVAGLWGGQKGTLLIWASFSALFLTINHRAWSRRLATAPDPAAFRRTLAWVELIGCLATLGFVVLLFLSGLFARTDPFLLNARPGGTGLQPVLRTPFMLIHPPIQFISYAISSVLFAAGLTAVLTRDRAWADIALPWARFGFVLATTGLGLGGLWAYYVLNFGGYWAWDPVETANLLAWFPLLLLLHAAIYYRKRGMYATVAPVFAALTLLMDLFSTIATRTGLWVSVHAFTDPSRNFEPDPLRRLLNILDTSVILQGLMAMFLLAILGVLAAYLFRIHQDSAAMPRPGVARPVSRTALVILAVAAALALFDVRFLTSGLFEVSNLVGFGNAPLGLGILFFGMALVVATPAHGTESLREKKGFWDLVDTPRLVFLGVILLSLAFLVVFLLQILSVNGYDRAVYDARAPIVALPILLVLPAALAHPTLGKRTAVYAAAAAGGLGLLLAVALRDHWQIWLLVPAFAWALAGTSVKLFKVSDPGPAGDRRIRWAGGLLLVAGVVDMLYWANPPSRIGLGSFVVHPSAWFAPVGILLGLSGTLAAAAMLRTSTIRAHRVGGLLAVLGFGFGIGLIASVAAIVLGESRRSLFPDAEQAKPLTECARGLRREIRKTGVYLMHVAIVVGLLGFTLSTYAQDEEQQAMLRPGAPVDVQGYQLTLVGAEGVGWDADQGTLKELHSIIEIRKDGALLDRVPLVVWLELFHHYAERVRVERFATEDVYIRPVALITPEKQFVAHEDNVVLTSGEVDAIAITVKTLPAMHLLWGSLWIIVAGMLVNLVASGSPWEFGRPASKASD